MNNEILREAAVEMRGVALLDQPLIYAEEVAEDDNESLESLHETFTIFV